MTLNDHRILISPVEALNADLLEAIAAEIERVFGFSTQTAPILQDISFALDPRRHQYHSTAILSRLAAARPPDILRILAVTQVDLFIPILTHVYGEALLGGAACIVSTFRLNENPPGRSITRKGVNRIVKEAVHEMGHTFNLRHCPDHACIMHYCRNEDDVDRKSDQLCRYCAIMLHDEIKRLIT